MHPWLLPCLPEGLITMEPIKWLGDMVIKLQYLVSVFCLKTLGKDKLFPLEQLTMKAFCTKNFFTITGSDASFVSHKLMCLEAPLLPSDNRMLHEEDSFQMERKRKKDEAQIQKEVEAHEKRIRKEIERQNILRRKREEQMQRKMELHDRDRRKEEERLMCNRRHGEVRIQREQNHELERQEKLLQKRIHRAEKLRQKEEQRRQKEAAKLKAAYEMASARKIARESVELIEGEQSELMELAASSMKLPSILSLDCERLQNLESFKDSLPSIPCS